MLESGGPENLLKLYQSYAETLIANQHDTFTEPFEIATKYMMFGLDTISTGEVWDMPKSFVAFANRSAFVEASIPSIYADFSLSNDVGPAITLPKYNNYPIRKQHIDDVTRAIIPLRSIGVKTVEEHAEGYKVGSMYKLPHHHHHLEKAQIGYAIFPSLGHFLPNNFDSSIR